MAETCSDEMSTYYPDNIDIVTYVAENCYPIDGQEVWWYIHIQNFIPHIANMGSMITSTRLPFTYTDNGWIHGIDIL
jgi:hypothetical protein